MLFAYLKINEFRQSSLAIFYTHVLLVLTFVRKHFFHFLVTVDWTVPEHLGFECLLLLDVFLNLLDVCHIWNLGVFSLLCVFRHACGCWRIRSLGNLVFRLFNISLHLFRIFRGCHWFFWSWRAKWNHAWSLLRLLLWLKTEPIRSKVWF